MRAAHEREATPASVLVVDVGGTHVKFLATGRRKRREFASGRSMTPEEMTTRVTALAAGWNYDVVAIGYPGAVRADAPVAEPYNLGSGWVGFDFAAAFARPVRMLNDAAMQALGAYRCGRMLFLGLGTGLGSTLIVDGRVVALELGHLPYRKRTFEDYVGARGRERLGKKAWRVCAIDVVNRLIAALLPDDVVIGGGNATHLKQLPAGCRLGRNADAFTGGYRLWNPAHDRSEACNSE